MSSKLPTEHLLRGIKSARVREAFNQVDRRLFVPPSHQGEAWGDYPLPIEDQATISQPSLVAKMTEWLNIGPSDRVLEIGTGSGYQTAILAELAAEVHTVEISQRLTTSALKRLDRLGYRNIHFHQCDGAEGWPDDAPYDRILATVAFPYMPEALLEQLDSDDSLAVLPVGNSSQMQTLTRYQMRDGRCHEAELLPVRFLTLRGQA